MKRLSQKGKDLINKPSEFNKNSLIKNAILYNNRQFNEMFLNQYKIESNNTLHKKVSAVSFKAKKIDHIGFYKEDIDQNHMLLNENYKLVLGLTTKSEVENCSVYNINFDPTNGGGITFLKESGDQVVKTHNVSPLRNIQTLDGPKGDSREQKFIISLHEKSKLFNLESFKSGTPKKLEESVIRKNGLNFIKPIDEIDLPKAVADQESRLAMLVEETYLFHMFNILKTYNTNEFIEFYVQNYKEKNGFPIYSKKEGLNCIRLHKNELNNDALVNLLKNLYGEDNINFLVEFPRDLNNDFMDIFNDSAKIYEFLTYSEELIRGQEVAIVYNNHGERVKESRIKDFNPDDINDIL